MAWTERMENLARLGEGDVFAFEQLAKRGVVGDPNKAAGELERKMQITDEPAEPRTFLGAGEGDLKNRLGPLGDDIRRPVEGKEGDAVMNGLGKIESKFPPILRRRVPAPFRKSDPIHREQNLDRKRPGTGKRRADNVHKLRRGMIRGRTQIFSAI
jgi:hypothetical protein